MYKMMPAVQKKWKPLSIDTEDYYHYITVSNEAFGFILLILKYYAALPSRWKH